MKRVLLWLLAGLTLALLVAVLGFRFWFQSVFIPSERCRQSLARSASQALGAECSLMPIQATSGSLYSDGFLARNSPDFRQLKADQIRAEVRIALWSRECTIEHVEISRLHLDLGAPSSERVPACPNIGRPPIENTETTNPIGSRFLVKEVTINDFQAALGGAEWKGTRFVAQAGEATHFNGVEWIANGRGGSIKSRLGPDWQVQTVDARLRGKSLFLTGAKLRTGERGEATLDCEFGSGNPHANVSFNGVPAVSWLPVDWRARLTGDLSGRLALTNRFGGIDTVEGNLTLSDGELTALPVLDQLATLTHTDSFRRLRIHKGSAQIVPSDCFKGMLRVNRLLLESEGLLKVEGDFEIEAGQINGTVQVGLTPSTLQWIPGAKERIFTTSRDGYFWTPVKLSGPADHPNEDLSARLAVAAAEKTVDDLQQGVQGTAKGVLDLVAPLLP